MKTWLTVAEAAEYAGREPRHDLHGMRASRDPARASSVDDGPFV